jgi:hypothetical protein
MLARYQIVRGKRPPGAELPDGKRIDVRAHREHVLSPARSEVAALLAEPSDAQFARFRCSYIELLERRFAADRSAFDALARVAQDMDVYLGCNCPTRRNPDVQHCHTTLALRFMQRKYPQLRVRLPSAARRGRAP